MALRDQVIAAADLPARLASLPGWAGDTTGIRSEYEIGWDAAVLMVAEVGPLAVELEHRPDMDIRWTGLRVSLTTHTAGDVVTELDLVTAVRLNEIARSHGASSVLPNCDVCRSLGVPRLPGKAWRGTVISRGSQHQLRDVSRPGAVGGLY